MLNEWPNSQVENMVFSRDSDLFSTIEAYLTDMVNDITGKPVLSERRAWIISMVGKLNNIFGSGRNRNYSVGEFANYIDNLHEVEKIPGVSEEVRVFLYTLFPDEGSFQEFLNWIDRADEKNRDSASKPI